MGEARNAERFARSAVDSTESTTLPRNHAIYELRLRRVLARMGQLDESIAVTGTAINNSEMLSGSRRIPPPRWPQIVSATPYGVNPAD